MWVDIEGTGTSIEPNTSEYTRSGMRKRGNVVIELSGTFDPATLVPLIGCGEAHIPAPPIAQSTPSTPVPAQARALVVMLDRDSTHDFSKLTWDGVAYSLSAPCRRSPASRPPPRPRPRHGLTIAGTGFDDNMAVLVGNAAATINSHTATSISVTSPAGPPGAADLHRDQPLGCARDASRRGDAGGAVSLGIEPDPNTVDLLRSVGAIDGDGHVVGSWFQDPIGGVRKILADPRQRAALVELLRSLLGDDGNGALHDGDAIPLLDPNGIGNVYITVSGDVIGVAAALSTPADAPVQVTASVRLPLLDTADDSTPVAWTAHGPLEITLELGLPQDAPATSLSLSATVDLQGHAAFSFVLDGVDVGAGPERLEVNSAHLGRDLVRAVETLVKDALSDVPGVDRLSDHLFGALGLDGVLPALPLDRLASDPAALRGWLARIASDASGPREVVRARERPARRGCANRRRALVGADRGPRRCGRRRAHAEPGRGGRGAAGDARGGGARPAARGWRRRARCCRFR